MLDVGTVLVVESDNNNRDIAFASAVKHGEIPIARSSFGEARSLLEKRRFKVVFCSDSLPDGEYAEVIRAARPTPRNRPFSLCGVGLLPRRVASWCVRLHRMSPRPG
jgi:CheY-like chemotaxis protein